MKHPRVFELIFDETTRRPGSGLTIEVSSWAWWDGIDLISTTRLGPCTPDKSSCTRPSSSIHAANERHIAVRLAVRLHDEFVAESIRQLYPPPVDTTDEQGA